MGARGNHVNFAIVRLSGPFSASESRVDVRGGLTDGRRPFFISLRLYRHREVARGELANRPIIFAELSGFLAIWEVNSLLRISYAEAHRFAGWPPAYVFPVS